MIENLGLAMRTMRVNNQMRLRDVADKTGLSISHLSDIELNRCEPSYRTLCTLARMYGMSLSYMFEALENEGHERITTTITDAQLDVFIAHMREIQRGRQ